MSYIKSTMIFIGVYSILLLVSLFINQEFSLHPEITINIAITVIAALALNKIYAVKSYTRIELLGLSGTGGLCAIIAIFSLAALYSDFETPNLFEASISFSSNALAVYLTLYFSSNKRLVQ